MSLDCISPIATVRASATNSNPTSPRPASKLPKANAGATGARPHLASSHLMSAPSPSTLAAAAPQARPDHPTSSWVNRVLRVIATWNAAWWVLLGALVAPALPGHWLTLVLAAITLVGVPLLVLGRAFAGAYPSSLIRPFVFRPFWYLQLAVPLMATRGSARLHRRRAVRRGPAGRSDRSDDRRWRDCGRCAGGICGVTTPANDDFRGAPHRIATRPRRPAHRAGIRPPRRPTHITRIPATCAPSPRGRSSRGDRDHRRSGRRLRSGHRVLCPRVLHPFRAAWRVRDTRES